MLLNAEASTKFSKFEKNTAIVYIDSLAKLESSVSLIDIKTSFKPAGTAYLSSVKVHEVPTYWKLKKGY